MRRRKLRKRRAKLTAPHAPVWDTAAYSVPTVPHLAQPPQPPTVPIVAPSSSTPSPGSGGESCSSSSRACHAAKPHGAPCSHSASTGIGTGRDAMALAEHLTSVAVTCP